MDYLEELFRTVGPKTEMIVFVDGELLRGEVRQYLDSPENYIEIVAAVVDTLDLSTLIGELDSEAEAWLAKQD